MLMIPSLVTFAQSGEYLVVVNGGLFGSSDYANIGVKNLQTGVFTSIDTIYENSVQDLLIEKVLFVGGSPAHYAYVAAQDSIVKYNLDYGTRLAATAFGAPSAIHLELYNDKLLAGNWYAPWGHVGAYTNHFRIFDANTLAYVDSIPQIEKPATDFVVVGDYAYITQNNVVAAGFGDTLGYLAVVDLVNMVWVRNDTLSTNGDEIGRLIVEDSVIYSLNGVSNTISSYNTTTGAKHTQATNVDLKPIGYANTADTDGQGVWFFPFDSGIGSYNLATNTVVNPSLIKIDGSFAFVYDSIAENFYVSHIDFNNQVNNKGLVYDMQGDSTGNFEVGYSPEALGLFSRVINSVSKLAKGNDLEYNLYPNPTVATINIELEKVEEVVVVLYNMLGQPVQVIKKEDKQFSISVENLPAATYYINITNEKGLTRSKSFVKQ